MARNIQITDTHGRIPFPAGGTLASGALHEIGHLAGVVLNDVVSGQTGVLVTSLRGPVVTGVKAATSQAWAQGDLLYLAGDTVTKTEGTGDNPIIGYAFVAKGEAAAVGSVLLAHGPIGAGE